MIKVTQDGKTLCCTGCGARLDLKKRSDTRLDEERRRKQRSMALLHARCDSMTRPEARQYIREQRRRSLAMLRASRVALETATVQ